MRILYPYRSGKRTWLALPLFVTMQPIHTIKEGSTVTMPVLCITDVTGVTDVTEGAAYRRPQLQLIRQWTPALILEESQYYSGL